MYFVFAEGAEGAFVSVRLLATDFSSNDLQFRSRKSFFFDFKLSNEFVTLLVFLFAGVFASIDPHPELFQKMVTRSSYPRADAIQSVGGVRAVGWWLLVVRLRLMSSRWLGGLPRSGEPSNISQISCLNRAGVTRLASGPLV